MFPILIVAFAIPFTAALVECGDKSYQCCWVIRAFQKMEGYEYSISSEFSWNWQNASACCFMRGTTCAQDRKTVIGLEWTKRKLKNDIPGKELGMLTNLKRLNNDLQGSVPADLGNLKQLEYLNFDENKKLRGVFPQAIADLSLYNLKYLHFGKYRIPISGTIYIYPNQNSGDYPSVVVGRAEVIKKECKTDCCTSILLREKLGSKSIRKSYFYNLQPTKCCYSSFGITCDGSKVKEISWTKRGLKGGIPSFVTELKSLSKLDLSANNLTGRFPTFLTETNITNLNLSHNQFRESPDKSYFTKKWDISITYQS